MPGEVSQRGQKRGSEADLSEMLYTDDEDGRDIQQALHNSLEEANMDLKPAAIRGQATKKTIDLKPPPEGSVEQASSVEGPTDEKAVKPAVKSTDEERENEAKEDEVMTEVPETKAASGDKSRNEMGNNGNEETEMTGQGNKDDEKPDNKIGAQETEDEEQDAGAKDNQETTTTDNTKDEQETVPKDDEGNDEGENTDKKEDSKETGKDSRRGTTVFSLSSSTSSSQTEGGAIAEHDDMSETFEDAMSSPKGNDGEEQ
eukprot:scaffold63381_cov45-Cyclotella_meneghiniana.AAC.1